MPAALAWAVSVSIPLIAVLVWGSLALGARRSGLTSEARRRFAVVAAGCLLSWLALVFVMAGSGAFRATPGELAPALALATGIVAPILVGALLLRRSSALRAVLAAPPPSWLIGVQLYRIVGAVFLILYSLGRLPGEFAIPAGAGDVAVGLAAPLVAALVHRRHRRSRIAAATWNVAGVLDLIVAIGTGLLTTPGPLHVLALEDPNSLITEFPLVLVPTFAVPLSILLHVASWWRLNLAVTPGAATEGSRVRPAEIA